MADVHGAGTPASTGFLTEADEMSLAQSRASQTVDSEPDTLEVRDDSLTLLQEQIEPWRRPARVLLGVVAVGLVVLIGAGVLTRRGGQPA
jgi:hypothetical protein